MENLNNQEKNLVTRMKSKLSEVLTWSNCLFYAIREYLKGGYFMMRRSKYYPGPHFLHGEKKEDGTIKVTSFVPDNPKIRVSPPVVFSGHVKGGDAETKQEKDETLYVYGKQLEALDEENAKLKSEIKVSKEFPDISWEKFKHTFNHHLNKFGKSISNTAKKNLKKN